MPAGKIDEIGIHAGSTRGRMANTWRGPEVSEIGGSHRPAQSKAWEDRCWGARATWRVSIGQRKDRLAVSR